MSSTLRHFLRAALVPLTLAWLTAPVLVPLVSPWAIVPVLPLLALLAVPLACCWIVLVPGFRDQPLPLRAVVACLVALATWSVLLLQTLSLLFLDSVDAPPEWFVLSLTVFLPPLLASVPLFAEAAFSDERHARFHAALARGARAFVETFGPPWRRPRSDRT